MAYHDPGAAETSEAATLYEHVGGEAGVHRLVATWYPTVLVDPLLEPLFGAGHADHVPHLTAFFGEVFGGPTRYTDELGGFPRLRCRTPTPPTKGICTTARRSPAGTGELPAPRWHLSVHCPRSRLKQWTLRCRFPPEGGTSASSALRRCAGDAPSGAELRRSVAGVSDLAFVRAGFGPDAVPYEDAWAEQRRLHAARVAGTIPDTVLLLEHPPVYTAGRRTTRAERPADGTPVIDVDRGGKITWHGPGQLVGYPIVALPDPVDVVAHVRRLERALIAVCARLGLAAEPIEGRSGVWVPADERGRDRKVAAIGIRVSHGVTMHGFALNCDPDLSWFDRIVPCGIIDASVTSITRELGRTVSVHDVLEDTERELTRALAPITSFT